MTTCNVKGIAHRKKPTESYQPALQSSSIELLSSLFWFYSFSLLIQSHGSHQPCLQLQQAAAGNRLQLVSATVH